MGTQSGLNHYSPLLCFIHTTTTTLWCSSRWDSGGLTSSVSFHPSLSLCQPASLPNIVISHKCTHTSHLKLILDLLLCLCLAPRKEPGHRGGLLATTRVWVWWSVKAGMASRKMYAKRTPGVCLILYTLEIPEALVSNNFALFYQ